jgi:hypothetical protein
MIYFRVNNNILKLLCKRYKLQVKGDFADEFFAVSRFGISGKEIENISKYKYSD